MDRPLATELTQPVVSAGQQRATAALKAVIVELLREPVSPIDVAGAIATHLARIIGTMPVVDDAQYRRITDAWLDGLRDCAWTARQCAGQPPSE